MMQTPDNDNSTVTPDDMTPRKPLSPPAQRALREAEQRRQLEKQQEVPTELGGRGGADPARFGDWEINGRAIDF